MWNGLSDGTSRKLKDSQLLPFGLVLLDKVVNVHEGPEVSLPGEMGLAPLKCISFTVRKSVDDQNGWPTLAKLVQKWMNSAVNWRSSGTDF